MYYFPLVENTLSCILDHHIFTFSIPSLRVVVLNNCVEVTAPFSLFSSLGTKRAAFLVLCTNNGPFPTGPFTLQIILHYLLFI